MNNERKDYIKDSLIVEGNCEDIKENSQCSEKVSRPFSQSFDSFEITYELDEKNHQLVKTGLRDVDKEIEAHRETCLQAILDKYLESDKDIIVEESDEILDYKNNNKFDISEYGLQLEEIDKIRDYYKLPLSSSPSEVLKFVNDLYLKNKENIKNLEEKEKLSNEEKKDEDESE